MQWVPQVGRIDCRENILRAYRFRQPEWVPVTVGLAPLLWRQYDAGGLDDIMLTHRILFPKHYKGAIDPEDLDIPPIYGMRGEPFTDGWSCVWRSAFVGMVGAVTYHPLADWEDFKNFAPPDPELTDGVNTLDWEQLRADAATAKQKGEFFSLGLPHGHTFLRLQDLRGYENLMLDMADENPNLWRLIKIVEDFNVELVRRIIELKPDMIFIPEDLGMQNSPMISPEMFRKYIKPSYLKITEPIKDTGIIVHEHSDGFILPLIDDIIEAGGDVINLQDLVNGIDNIREHVKGRIAIDLDIDRQGVTVTGSIKDIDDLIREAVEKLGSREGGLSLSYQPWPPIPIENIRAVCDAMEKYCTYWA